MGYAVKLMELIKRLFDGIRKNPDRPVPRPIPNPVEWIMYHFFRKTYCKRHRKWIEAEAKMALGNYPKQVVRIREKVLNGEQIKVLFLVDELAKWKAASLYFALQDDKRFDPVVGLTIPANIIGATPRNAQMWINEADAWFLQRGYRTIRLYDALKGWLKPLEETRPDIVFYPEVWYDTPLHIPSRVSNFALTCYIPYFVPNYVDVPLDCQQDMHQLYWRHFVQNDELASIYGKATADRTMAGKFVGVGHTMFDVLHNTFNVGESKEKIIIYAPHWTFDHPKNRAMTRYSTFTVTGRPILEYAKAHPEFKWVFKPHPSLYFRIVQSGLMTKADTDRYYSDWERIGNVCVGSDYMDLFQKSFAMITDCGSFLSEYGATGHPLIHLISARNTKVPPPSIKALYDTYYKVHNLDEMITAFKEVIELGHDQNRDIRLAAVKALNMTGNNAAANIKGHILKELNLQ